MFKSMPNLSIMNLNKSIHHKIYINNHIYLKIAMIMLIKVINIMNKISQSQTMIVSLEMYNKIKFKEVIYISNKILGIKIIIVIKIIQFINNIKKIQVINRDIHPINLINKVYLRIFLILINKILKLLTKTNPENHLQIKNKD